MPKRAVFDYGRLEIIRKWGKMKELEMGLNLDVIGSIPVEVYITQ
jgi:hypothetical protein